MKIAFYFLYWFLDIINIPDPELLILFGDSNGLIGYLPWHIRLSEIM